MDDLQIATLILVVGATAFGMGFLAGYSIRAAISHDRYIRAQRHRIDSWQSSGLAELTGQADELANSAR